MAMVVGNHSGGKQDDVFSTGVTTEKKEDNGENGKVSQKEETNLSSENSNTQNDSNRKQNAMCTLKNMFSSGSSRRADNWKNQRII